MCVKLDRLETLFLDLILSRSLVLELFLLFLEHKVLLGGSTLFIVACTLLGWLLFVSHRTLLLLGDAASSR